MRMGVESAQRMLLACACVVACSGQAEMAFAQSEPAAEEPSQAAPGEPPVEAVPSESEAPAAVAPVEAPTQVAPGDVLRDDGEPEAAVVEVTPPVAAEPVNEISAVPVQARVQVEGRAAQPASQQAADPTEPPTPWLTLGLSMDYVRNTDAGYGMVSEDGMGTRPGVWLAVDTFHWERHVVAIEAGWGVLGESARLHDQADTRMVAQHLYTGLAYRYALSPWMALRARLTAGAMHAALELETNTQTRFEAARWLPVGQLGVGLVFNTPAGLLATSGGGLRSLQLGWLIEGGYQATPEVEFRPSIRDAAAGTNIASWGQLAFSGPYLRLGLFAQL